MFRAIAASSRGRLLSVGLLTVAATITITTDAAQARRHHRSHRHHTHEASYSPPFSSIVVDANSGAVLQANSADGVRHPASLTKIMTLYLLFERLEAGKIALDSEMKVSEHASDQAPTKLGLRPGQTIEVEDAIKGLVTRSANDAAVTIAETLGGSEDNFAKLMTRKARALGMSKTVYRNASGLPDDEQVTTARDQSILGRSIQERFPKYYRYFATNDFHFRGNVIRNHNHLLGNVEGVDGIKTGYTRASGFNLVTSIRRGNRHLVAVVLGGRSASSRDSIMRNLLAEHMDEASTKRTVAAITEKPEAKSFDDRVAGLDPAQKQSEVASAADDDTTRDNDALSILPVPTATLRPP
jgi:D-alanyl-D-alanine carboxypeptidase